MKKLLLSLMILFAFALSGLAQSANQDAEKTTTYPVKGGTYTAPAQVTKTQVVPATQTVAGTTSAVNPNSVNGKTTDEFPTFINTGNPQLDQDNYDKAKQEWIARNPEKYREMQQPQNPKK